MPAILQKGERELSHHAFYIEGDRRAIIPDLLRFLENDRAFATRGNPDFLLHEYDVFGIDDALRLRDTQSQKPIAGDRRIFVISARGLTREAQNSLLKTFEEPSRGTHFFLVIPSASLFLPTLLSRMESFSITSAGSSLVAEEGLSCAHAFLAARPKERLRLLHPLIANKDIGEATAFVDDLERYLAPVFRTDPQRGDIAVVLRDIHMSREFLSGRSPSVKMIIEHLALTVPRENAIAHTL